MSGKKNQRKHKLFGPNFLRTFLTLTLECPGVKKFLPITRAAGKRTFRCGCPRFSARTSMTRRVLEKLCTEKVCVDFLALKWQCLLEPVFGRTDFSRIFIFGPPDFFADFAAGFFLLILWEKCPEKSSRNPPQFIQQKSPTHFCRGARPMFGDAAVQKTAGHRSKQQSVSWCWAPTKPPEKVSKLWSPSVGCGFPRKEPPPRTPPP